jgi:hypothetical protein
MQIDQQEFRRRDYELKRHEFFLKLKESYFERAFKVATGAIIGNTGALTLFASISKPDVNIQLQLAFKSALLYFVYGSVASLIALGGTWTMSQRVHNGLDRIASENFPEGGGIYDDHRSLLSRLITWKIIPHLTTISFLAAAFFFIAGILQITALVLPAR